MKTIYIIVFFWSSHSLSFMYGQDINSKEISGTITTNQSIISGAIIHNLNSNVRVLSNSEGNYIINAKVGHKIKFSSLGYGNQVILVEDVTDVLNIDLKLKATALDAVEIQSKKKLSNALLGYNKGEDKALDKYFEGIDMRRAAFSNNFIKGSDIPNIYNSIQDALIGKVSGYTIINGKPYLRGGRSSITNDYHAIWDVDGNITTDVPSVDINNIKAIYILKSLAYTVKYGTIGAGGVIVVVTKNGPYDNNPEKKKELADLQNKIIYANDASTVLATLRGNSEESKGFENHPEKLKADAYQYQKDESQQEAITYYEDVFNLRPQYAQSYRDLANAYIQGGQYHKAWKLYMSYAFHHNLSKEEGIGEIIYNEMEWLYYNRQAAAKITQPFVPSYSNKKDFERDIRVVFEWNTSEAEFDLEFVNPDQQVYTFEHTLVANEVLIQDEKTRGYSSKEFSIPEIDHRDWLVNMTYYGNKKYDPTYFKVTTYYNWGRPNQTQKVRVFKLEETDVKYQLLKYNNNSVRINY